MINFPLKIEEITKGWRVKVRIRAVRKAKGISQTALALAIGKTPGTMWKYEHNLVPMLVADLYICAQVLEVSMEELLELEPTFPPIPTQAAD